MRISELIESLKKYPLDAEVLIDSGDGEVFYDIDDIEGESEHKYGEVIRVLLK